MVGVDEAGKDPFYLLFFVEKIRKFTSQLPKNVLEMFIHIEIPRFKIISQRTSFSLQSSLFSYSPHITSRFLSRVDFQPPPRDSSPLFDDLFYTVSRQNFICFFNSPELSQIACPAQMDWASAGDFCYVCSAVECDWRLVSMTVKP